MSLTVVSIPIGNVDDITLRAIETLKSSDIIICEELKPAKVLLKRLGMDPEKKVLHPLNEHSSKTDVTALLDICRKGKVALISDCGTPGFCDPGADLVEACHREKIPLDVNPGPSSLMALLALSGVNLKEFHFVGFLPAQKEERLKKIDRLKGVRIPFVVMDTPYRLQATLRDLAVDSGNARAILGIDLTGRGHQVVRDKLKALAAQEWPKEPFVLMVLP